ncbi:hypothetical protein M1563_02285 [Patescibacteria group bacterium]|nr:hypothetical protein [Patescibacteria group bacterium]MCL5409619.1 hypothetical protein [Patescibacteria group bacterium]
MKLFSRKILLATVLLIIVKLLLAAISFHADVQAFDFGGWLVSHGNIANLYDYLPSLPADSPILKMYPVDFLIYPPLIYFYHGLFAFIFDVVLRAPFKESFLFDVNNVFGDWTFNLHLLLLKVPYLFFDLATAYFLSRLFDDRRKKTMAAVLWLVNPVSNYATYLMGQFDVIPTFFMILSLWVVQRQKSWLFLRSEVLGTLALGLGASFKISPLFLLIPLSSLFSRWKTRILLVLLGLGTYVIFLLPFLASSGFRHSALIANQTLKSLYPEIMISGGEGIMLFLLSLLFLYFIFYSRLAERTSLWQRYLLTLLLFFTFTHYHPQWFVWITPFFIIELVSNQFKHLYLVLVTLLSFLGLLFFFDPGLSIGLFAPVAPTLHTTASLWDIIGLNMDYTFWRSILQTLFAAVAAFYFYLYFPRSSKI